MGASTVIAVPTNVAAKYQGYGRVGASATVADVRFDDMGRKVVTAKVTFSASYANPAGESIDLAKLGLRRVDEVWHLADNSTATGLLSMGGIWADWDLSTPTAPKARLFSAVATEVVNTTDVSGRSVIARFVGT